MNKLISIGLALSLLGAVGCKKAEDVDLGPQVPETEAARGVHINKITVNQGVQITAMEGGSDVLLDEDTNLASVIAGREGVLRVHVELDDDFEEREITAVLRLGDQDPRIETFTPTEDSSNQELDSTINFHLAAADVEPGLDFSVELLESEDGDYAGSDGDTLWPEDGRQDLDVEETDEIEIVIIPIKYNADNSGRVPDTSDQALRSFKREARRFYPAHTITVSVTEPLAWNQRIEPTGGGWNQLLATISGYRSQDDGEVRANTYYYGLFNPEPSAGEFCAGGQCILGLSLLGGPRDVWSRASIGLGYAGLATSTLVHEVGHAQGREHSNCGLYGQPSDRDYPYNNARIGGPGYDIVQDKVITPGGRRDFMSYCEPYWVSDYTYEGLTNRMQNLAGQDRRAGGPKAAYRQLLVDGEGNVTRGERFELSDEPGGHIQTLQIRDKYGYVVDYTEGYFTPFSHLDGGWIMVPEDQVHEGDKLEVLGVY